MSDFTKLYRAVVYVVDIRGLYPNKNSIRDSIEDTVGFSDVAEVQETDCGPWHDGHELNRSDANPASYFPNLDPSTDLQKAYEELNSRYLQSLDQLQAARLEAQDLRKEILKLHKVQEFVKTIGGLIE